MVVKMARHNVTTAPPGYHGDEMLSLLPNSANLAGSLERPSAVVSTRDAYYNGDVAVWSGSVTEWPASPNAVRPLVVAQEPRTEAGIVDGAFGIGTTLRSLNPAMVASEDGEREPRAPPTDLADRRG